MKTLVTPLVLSILVSIGTLSSQSAENPAWPKGIDPASLLEHNDPEPDLKAEGFIDLFNGRDLSGWTPQGGAMQFTVVDGAIVGTNVQGQPNGFLCTDASYSDFIFTMDFKWDVLGNSGLMFRSGLKDMSEVELKRMKGDRSVKRVFGYQSEMDVSDRRWTGGIYGEAMGGWKYPLSKPEGHTAARAAIQDHTTWNRMTVYAEGDTMKTWINGVPCANLINSERSEGLFGLQVHSGKEGTILWKNIRIKELKKNDAVDLFGSGDFSQWRKAGGAPVSDGWSIKQGVVHRHGMKAGDLITAARYENFELDFEWKISEAGNSGIKYRYNGKLGPEYQVLDDTQHNNRSNPLHCAAALYGLKAAADSKTLQPVGEWNRSRIVARGNQLEHWLNDQKVMAIEVGSPEWQERRTKSKFRDAPDFATGAGHILLQDHGNPVWYRKLHLREIKK